MSEQSAPRAPSGLGKRGRRYWRSILATYELSDSELELLTEACRTLDNLDTLDRAIAEAGPTVMGSAGQSVVNPAFTEARGQRTLLHRLIAALALPDDEGDAVPSGHSQRGKAANRARWRGHVKDAG